MGGIHEPIQFMKKLSEYGGNIQLTEKNGYVQTDEGDIHNLTITPVSSTHAGIYACFGKETRTVTVVVLGNHYIITKHQ